MTLRGYFNLGVALIFLVILSFILVHIINNREVYGVSQYLWFSFISCLYGLVIYVIDVPEEQIHFIEYGILSGLIYMALSQNVHNISVYFLSAFVVFVFGAIDEVIQWILPDRIFDLRDILMNGIAGILVQLLIAMVINQKKVLINHGKNYV